MKKSDLLEIARDFDLQFTAMLYLTDKRAWTTLILRRAGLA